MHANSLEVALRNYKIPYRQVGKLLEGRKSTVHGHFQNKSYLEIDVDIYLQYFSSSSSPFSAPSELAILKSVQALLL